MGIYEARQDAPIVGFKQVVRRRESPVVLGLLTDETDHAIIGAHNHIIADLQPSQAIAALGRDAGGSGDLMAATDE
jgi:hypothetical protein